MAGVVDEIKGLYAQSAIVAKYILINIGIYLALKVFSFILWAAQVSSFDLIDWLALPAAPHELITRPWTLVTYMFLHEGFWHLLMNMLWLHFGGRILYDLMGSKRFIKTYWMGGLVGGTLYLLAFNLLPAFQGSGTSLLGASAAVFAVFIAISTYSPDYQVVLPFIGPVKLKWIAIIFIILQLPNNGGNIGGHIAHAGGAIWGFMWASQLKNGRDLATWFDRLADQVSTWSLPRRRKTFKVHKNPAPTSPKNSHMERKSEMQQEIDRILDKISKSGYESLSSKEKETLFKASDKS
ncbi:MAG: rhomboid family intramembrane serine protease [Bacteroidetes bacterium]|jgi:membrane associated rhomboid family serine protease|nr:rhomboid family intramembrane serine protease [Bacteroidota bacterium]